MPFRDHRPETRILLGAQLVFNIGFYAVVPFLAGAMGTEYGLDAAAIGLVLGARTFSQQGMFLLGGMLADRWGARRSILTGCLVRIAGYATLAAASDFALFLLGAVLTGAGGALFSPALESWLSHADRPGGSDGPDRAGGGPRSVFVWLAITGEIGAVLGPVLGSLLLGWGFDAALAVGIGVFAVVTVTLWYLLPAEPAHVPPDQDVHVLATRTPAAGSRWACLRDRRFVAFCALAGMNVLAYHQLYFAVPVELSRRGLDGAWLGALFLLASVLTLLLQLPVSTAGLRMGPGRALAVGFVLEAGAFTLAALTSVHPGTAAGSVAPLMGAVSILILGHMLLTPTILSLIPSFVPAQGPASGRGAYYGLAATCGGIAVLAGNAVLGQLLDLTDRHHWWPGTPWTPLVVLALLAAGALPVVLRGHSTTGPADSSSSAAPAGRTS
ncbi:MFS transporter [Kocuria nitroreducens]|uniref:MFS transporter n=1 Tax=Kocuria nitroreducens TaxID=3058914 RepID=UPI0036DEFB74